MDGLLLGRVIEVHQHDNSLDIQLVYDGSRLTGVPVISSAMTTSSGFTDLHHPEGNEWDKPGSKTRDVYVVVGCISRQYIALGFFSPQVNQMLFDRVNFKIDRHASDVYSTIDKDGNAEWFHPSGTYVRVGTEYEHENLTAKDFDKHWKITRNKDKPVHFHITVANQQAAPAFTFNVYPDGTVRMWAKKNIYIESETHIVLNAPRIDENPSWGKGTGGPTTGGVPE